MLWITGNQHEDARCARYRTGGVHGGHPKTGHGGRTVGRSTSSGRVVRHRGSSWWIPSESPPRARRRAPPVRGRREPLHAAPGPAVGAGGGARGAVRCPARCRPGFGRGARGRHGHLPTHRGCSPPGAARAGAGAAGGAGGALRRRRLRAGRRVGSGAGPPRLVGRTPPFRRGRAVRADSGPGPLRLTQAPRSDPPGLPQRGPRGVHLPGAGAGSGRHGGGSRAHRRGARRGRGRADPRPCPAPSPRARRRRGAGRRRRGAPVPPEGLRRPGPRPRHGPGHGPGPTGCWFSATAWTDGPWSGWWTSWG